jgi:hypothetical protein
MLLETCHPLPLVQKAHACPPLSDQPRPKSAEIGETDSVLAALLGINPAIFFFPQWER